MRRASMLGTLRLWAIYAARRATCSGGMPDSGAPSYSTSPESAGSSPSAVFSSVLLPQPFGPSSTVTQPAIHAIITNPNAPVLPSSIADTMRPLPAMCSPIIMPTPQRNAPAHPSALSRAQ